MAINVYLTIFRKYKPDQLKSLEWKYHVLCYGFPTIIAFVYIFISTSSRGRIYGDATLWCWIDINWVVLRIALVYAPAWFCILASFCIYVLAGREIFSKRQELRAFSAPPGHFAPIENPFTDFKTTEIKITSELATLRAPHPEMPNVHFSSENDKVLSQNERPSAGKDYTPYSATIVSDPMSAESEAVPPPTPKPTPQQRNNRAALQANTAAWGYTKVALLFFISLLVTWVSMSSAELQVSALQLIEPLGTILHQQGLFSHPSRTHLTPFYLRLRRGVTADGLLEFCHLHRVIMDRNNCIIHWQTSQSKV